jgi:hypothetical protein
VFVQQVSFLLVIWGMERILQATVIILRHAESVYVIIKGDKKSILADTTFFRIHRPEWTDRSAGILF